MANLGYVGHFSPSSLAIIPPESGVTQDPESFGVHQNTDEERRGRLGLNTVLEQWLADALVAGHST
jgi:hypothetical protein